MTHDDASRLARQINDETDADARMRPARGWAHEDGPWLIHTSRTVQSGYNGRPDTSAVTGDLHNEAQVTMFLAARRTTG